VRTGERKLLKRMSLPSGYDTSKYTTERVWAPGRDGTLIPVSLAYRRGLQRDGTAPLIQAGYGAYGSSRDASFNPQLISALDRGAVFAQAHVRGGFEMGRSWYEGGRQLNKKNTFTDFIDVTRFLVREGYADKKRVAAVGGSAGGLLVAAVANMAPSEYRVVFAAVPFVDVLTTMLDESIPMTTIEYDEWGDPRDRKFHDYMLSYSPYDNVRKQAYPAMLVTAGLWDSQVQYYEPTKWVARLRDRKTDSNPLVLRMEMQSGHDGNSGRFREQRDNADEWAFVLSQLGVAEVGSQ
jgi:oligopeptidase B